MILFSTKAKNPIEVIKYEHQDKPLTSNFGVKRHQTSNCNLKQIKTVEPIIEPCRTPHKTIIEPCRTPYKTIIEPCRTPYKIGNSLLTVGFPTTTPCFLPWR